MISRRCLGLIVLFTLIFSVIPMDAPLAGSGELKFPPTTQGIFKEVDKLTNEQKYQAALKRLEDVIEKDQQKGLERARLLIKRTQLQLGLHGFEKALLALRKTKWPQGKEAQALLKIYYVHALRQYVQRYGWEIRQREAVEAGNDLDLKKWSLERLNREIGNQFWELWKTRKAWGKTPVSAAKEFIAKNNYPANVRSTLRDYLTYSWVEHLQDSSFWSPAQNNEVHRINLKGETRSGQPHFSTQQSWQELHPLSRAARILKDLESWHKAGHQYEGALEAKLSRIKLFLAHYTQASSRREQLMKSLRQTVTSAEKVPWKSKAYYDLALERSREKDPKALIEARNYANQGKKLFPKSPGAQLCESLIQQLGRPSYTLEGMLLDGTRRHSLRLRFKNLNKIYFRAYAVDLEKSAAKEKDYNFFPNRNAIIKLTKDSQPAVEWETALKSTKDLREHSLLVVPPIKKKGYYVVVASAAKDFNQTEKNRVTGIHFIRTELILETERMPDGSWKVRSLNGNNGERMGGVNIRLYRFDWKNGHSIAQEKVTNSEGEATLNGGSGNTYYLFAQKGQDLSLIQSGVNFYPDGHPGRMEAYLVYTDRSIYRPGQKILWKVVAFGGENQSGKYTPLKNTRLEVSLRDSNHKNVKKLTVTTNEFGTASGEYQIPSGRLLGDWTIEARRNPGRSGQASIKVEEYKRPTFEVSLGESKKAMKVNVAAVVKGSVKYYHGLPVTSGTVRWTVSRQKIFPWWWAWYYWRGGGGTRNQILTAGTSKLNEKGEYEIRFVPEADPEEEKKEMSYSYSLAVDVTDEGGETRSTSRSYRVGFVAVQGQVSKEVNFFMKGNRPKFSISRRSLAGKALAGKGRYRVYRIRQPKLAPMPADILRPNPEPNSYQHPHDFKRARWETDYNWQQTLFLWKSGAMVQSGRVKHDKSGMAKVSLNKLPPGPYRLEYKTRDRFGKEAKVNHDFLVVGKGMKLNLPLVVMAEKFHYQVGDKVRLLVHSGFPEQAISFHVGKGRTKTLRQIRRQSKAGSFHEFPLGPEWRGGLFVQAAFIRDFQKVSVNQSIGVPWENKALKVEFERIRKKMEPGSKEQWTIRVKGPDKKGGLEAGEMLAYMYDRSLEAFAPHSYTSPLGFYPSMAYNSYPLNFHLQRAGSFRLWGSGWGYSSGPSYHGDNLIGFANYGIGGLGSRGGGGRHRLGAIMEGEEMMAMEADMATPAAKEPAPPPKASPQEVGRASGRNKKMAKEKAEPSRRLKDGKQDVAGEPPVPGAEEKVRKNFSETAFWQPHLRWKKNGQVALSFQVPDSVTSWKVWAHALTSSIQSGTAETTVESVKDLMVRPYLPRFVREGDKANVKIVVQNAGKKKLSVVLTAQIQDPKSGKSLLAEFGVKGKQWSQTVKVPAGGSANATLKIKVPARLGMVKVIVKGKAGKWTDGEERPLPVLPSRMHLLQSRFAALRKGKPRELKFPDMAKGDDKSLIHKQLVMTVDAQLLYSVLSALPYLVNYPYECVEQTLNRFVSTAILTKVFGSHPLVKKMAAGFAKKRNTQFEKWRMDDPNRLLMMEETPWMAEAEGGRAKEDELLKVLDPKVAKAQKTSALAKLKDAQTAIGAFPWYPGGRPSPYMTLLVVHGISKTTELGVEVPKAMVVKAWNYLLTHIRTTPWQNLGVHFLTYLNYVASSYPDDSWTGNFFQPGERAKILDYTFKYWKSLPPLNKAQLALTLHRMKRPAEAKLVFDSIMDSSKTTEDEGTFWIAEDRAWLWYNDTIEGHAWALRAMTEMQPKDERRDGLVQWLFLNKKLSHWKSTRATAEVLYSLVYYMKQEKQIGIEERVKLQAGPEKKEFVFKPDDYTGKSKQWVIPGNLIKPKQMAVIKAEKTDRALGFVSATWHFSTEKLPEKGDGDFLSVSREYFVRSTKNKRKVLTPLKKGMKLKVGDEVEVHLSLRSKQAMEYVHLRDPRAAGLEPGVVVSKWAWDLGLARYEEVRDSATNFFIEWLPAGEYTLKYRVKANMAGEFRVGPARLQAMYAPEFGAYSAGHLIQVQ